ncbi:SDR family NAD(P)-dependent oxidoreductase [Streptomyces sp. NPDC059072]|uniref:SDR family NAD(P)-dependent oxidoreductase n=1 Tax=unclassified Streptomyces TaxID=2593676 RepID=UPI0036812325
MPPATVALITGGTSGLGLAVAERLMACGVLPVVFGRSEERGRSALKTLGGSAVFVRGDVAGESEVAAAVDAATRHGSLRIVVNCAGVPHAAKVIGRAGPHSLRQFTDVVTANLVGTFNVVRLAAERMAANPPVEQERGVIVNTASLAAFDGQVGQAAYAASKGGIVSMTLPLARELAGSLIRVVTVAPGFFTTPAVAAVPAAARGALDRDLVHPQRWGNPAEFAGLVAHIVENQMINGETIRLDGAVRMSPGLRRHGP